MQNRNMKYDKRCVTSGKTASDLDFYDLLGWQKERFPGYGLCMCSKHSKVFELEYICWGEAADVSCG